MEIATATIKVPPADITHIVVGDDTTIFTSRSRIRIFLPIEEVMQQLPSDKFFRVSRSTIIAFEYLGNTTRHNNIQVGNYRVPFTRHYRQQVMQKLATILNEQIAFYESKIPGSLR